MGRIQPATMDPVATAVSSIAGRNQPPENSVLPELNNFNARIFIFVGTERADESPYFYVI
jgi:hypothetical protein